MIPVAGAKGAGPAEAPAAKQIECRSPWRLAFERLRADRAAQITFAVIVTIVAVALLAQVFAAITHHGPNQQFIDTGEDESGGPVPPSGTFWLGTDSSGRDLFIRILYGARVSLTVGVLATGVSVITGVVFGLVAGYLGGVVDSIIARMIDVLLSLPFFLIALALAYRFGPSEWLVIFVIGFFSFTALARIVRGQVISLKNKEYVEAARALGARAWRIMFIDLLPNVMAQVIVYASILIPAAIVSEAALSFLGVGIPPPAADWGSMIGDASGWYQNGYWWYLFFPMLALLGTTLAFNIFGDSVRDAMDPRGGMYV